MRGMRGIPNHYEQFDSSVFRSILENTANRTVVLSIYEMTINTIIIDELGERGERVLRKLS